jgi:isopenicillin N synthase-like dioxygenase
MIPYSPPQPVDVLPIIDVGSAGSGDTTAKLRTAAAIRRACLDTGFFYISNHGIDASLVESQFDWSKKFFDLPAAEKNRLAQANSHAKRGYEQAGTQALDDGSAPDLKESFRCGLDVGLNHPFAQQRLPTYGPSQWPENLPGFREQMERYAVAVGALGDRVLSLIALSLELDEQFFAGFYGSPMATVRLLKYPPQPADSRGNLLGAGAHTDWGGITILAQDAIGGLEVCNVDGVWVAATPVEDTFVVNLGEMIARWSNERYRSNMHRVRNNSSAVDRYSVAFFYDPEYTANIECIPSCLAQGETPAYAPCTSGEHIAEMHRRTASHAAA